MTEKEVLTKKLEELESEYAKTKHNKATNKHIGLLRAKIANTKKKMVERKKGRGKGYSVKKTGDATVALVGFPNAGKSSLQKLLTHVDSKVADYAFTTLDAIPGIMQYNGAKIQIFDLPGLIEGAHIGKGGGAQIASVIRVADLLLFVIDSGNPQNLYILLKELNDLGIHAGKSKPEMRMEKLNNGGIRIESKGHKIPEKDAIIKIINEFGIFNCAIHFSNDATEDDLIDFLAGSDIYIDAIVAINKIDVNEKYLQVKSEIENKTKLTVIPISALRNLNIEDLRKGIFKALKISRIYLKPKDGNPDYQNPLIVDSKSTVFDVAKKLHSDIAKNVKYAYVTGKSVKFKNQKVGREHQLLDEDILTLIYQN